jgi:hypothetical protein
LKKVGINQSGAKFQNLPQYPQKFRKNGENDRIGGDNGMVYQLLVTLWLSLLGK